MATNTAGHYTVECSISKEEYTNWLKDHYSHMHSNEISPAFAFKTYLKQKVEEQIWEHFHQHGGASTHAKIADITFSYNNSRLIKMLK